MRSEALFSERCCCESDPHPMSLLYLSAGPDDFQLELMAMLSLVDQQRRSHGKR